MEDSIRPSFHEEPHMRPLLPLTTHASHVQSLSERAICIVLRANCRDASKEKILKHEICQGKHLVRYTALTPEISYSAEGVIPPLFLQP